MYSTPYNTSSPAPPLRPPQGREGRGTRRCASPPHGADRLPHVHRPGSLTNTKVVFLPPPPGAKSGLFTSNIPPVFPSKPRFTLFGLSISVNGRLSDACGDSALRTGGSRGSSESGGAGAAVALARSGTLFTYTLCIHSMHCTPYILYILIPSPTTPYTIHQIETIYYTHYTVYSYILHPIPYTLTPIPYPYTLTIPYTLSTPYIHRIPPDRQLQRVQIPEPAEPR
jgi:hypothetical protein